MLRGAFYMIIRLGILGFSIIHKKVGDSLSRMEHSAKRMA